jgi:hypothetical protein
VIPRFGYRLDDMCDEYAVVENPAVEAAGSIRLSPSAEVYEPAAAREPLAVREPATIYYLRGAA